MRKISASMLIFDDWASATGPPPGGLTKFGITCSSLFAPSVGCTPAIPSFVISAVQRADGEPPTPRREGSSLRPLTLEYANGCAKRTKVPERQTRHLPACPCPASALLSLRRRPCRAFSLCSCCYRFPSLPLRRNRRRRGRTTRLRPQRCWRRVHLARVGQNKLGPHRSGRKGGRGSAWRSRVAARWDWRTSACSSGLKNTTFRSTSLRERAWAGLWGAFTPRE